MPTSSRSTPKGHDLFVLQGFPWERGTPAVIECEFEDTKTAPLGYTFHDLSKYLVDKGYQVYVSKWHPITRYGIPHDWRALMRYPCELADPKGWGNLLAFRTAPSAWPRPNRRLRAGEPATALPMVLLLHEQQPWTMFADNALYAARKLGLTDITSIDQLYRHYGREPS